MRGWQGRALVFDASCSSSKVWEYGGGFAFNYIGGRGFAARILWDFLPRGTDPLGPDNLLVFAAGPLTGFPGPGPSKLVVAAKSPLTGGYGDGNVGGLAAVRLRECGFDALVVRGAAPKPSVLVVEGGGARLEPAEDLWGLDAYECERRLRERYGKGAGVLLIGPAGENLVPLATVVCEGGRSGGRPGIGAVMGSKRIKAVVFLGGGELKAADPEGLRRVAAEAYREVSRRPSYGLWLRQGTMAAVRWAEENSVLPVMNFSEGVLEDVSRIDGYALERLKARLRGCPLCNSPCGNSIEVDGRLAELDYEGVAMLGPNLLIEDLRDAARLSLLADLYGIDSIGLGVVLGFAMEARERGLLPEAPEWGDVRGALELAEDIVHRRGELGELLSRGVAYASLQLGADGFAMHVKGLEVTAYDCHAAPGMALAYGTSPIGAHHKDAWIISWEVNNDRLGYTRAKVRKLIEQQRVRGGLFEFLVACRLPWVELGLPLDWYLRLLRAATGVSFTFEQLWEAADRVYALIRAFWIRERGEWSRLMDWPPRKWFEKPLTRGPLRGAKLDLDGYSAMLSWYYEERGWDERGVPRRSTLEKLGLEDVASTLEGIVGLSP